MIFLIIYLIGLVVAYIITRNIVREPGRTWSEVLLTFAISLTSIFGLLIVGLAVFIEKYEHKIGFPPKWL